MKKCFLVIPLFLLELTGCDCYVAVKGKVLSSSTGKPVEGATIEMVERNIETTTNKKGQFLIDEQTGFCYDPEIEITMTGYKPFHLTISSDSETTSYQIKTESESFDFEKPVYLDSTRKETFVNSTWIDQFSHRFEVKGDSIIFYLDENNPEKEVELIKEKLKNSG